MSWYIKVGISILYVISDNSPRQFIIIGLMLLHEKECNSAGELQGFMFRYILSVLFVPSSESHEYIAGFDPLVNEKIKNYEGTTKVSLIQRGCKMYHTITQQILRWYYKRVTYSMWLHNVPHNYTTKDKRDPAVMECH